MTAATETRAKYTAAEIEAMGKKGHAYKNPDGHYSYPIGDAEDLQNAIHAVGRGGADHDAIRRHIISRAKALGLSSRIPDSWTPSGESQGLDRAAFELRKRRRGSMSGKPERRGLLFDTGKVELRARPSGHGTTNYEFNGYAVVYEQPFQMWDQWGDEYQENVETRACAPSVGRPDLDTPFLIGHDDGGIALARTRSGTMRLGDDSHGLHVNVPELDGRSPLVQSLASAIERGDMDEMSVGFVCRQQKWSDDYMTRSIREMDIHRGDVSIVVTAANPATAGATLTVPVLEAASARRRTEDRAASHPPFTGTHSHAHPAYGDGGQHEHEHAHDGDADHDHHRTTDDPDSDGLAPMVGANDRSSGRPVEVTWAGTGQTGVYTTTFKADQPGLHTINGPLEQLARGEVKDADSHPDENVPSGPVGNGATAVKCPYTKRNGCGQVLPGGSRFCNNCGGPIYDGDGLMVLDDAGVVEEVAGAQGDANLLSLRLRLLELA